MPFGSESMSDTETKMKNSKRYLDSHQCLSAVSPCRTPDAESEGGYALPNVTNAFRQ